MMVRLLTLVLAALLAHGDSAAPVRVEATTLRHETTLSL